MELSVKYHSLKKLTKNQPVENWLRDWEKTYNDALALDLLDIKNNRPLYDFLYAVKAIDPTFAIAKLADIKEKVVLAQELPSISTLIKVFRNNYRRD